MNLKQHDILKLTGLCGILSTIVFLLFIALAVYFSPWFSWTENWLSEMAGSTGDTPIWAALGLPSVILNVGLVLSGLTGIIFTFALRKSRMFKSRWGRLATVVLFVDMSALCGVGIFPLTLGKLHVWNSWILFALIPVFLLFVGYELGKLFRKEWRWLTFALLLFCFCSFIVFSFVEGKAISEMISLCSVFVVFAALGFKFLSLGFRERYLSIVQ